MFFEGWSMNRVLVWDLPTRIFHWALVICVTGAFISVQIGGNAMVWHGRFGLAVLGLLVFRIVWGFIGSTYARFTQFVRGPAAIKAYLRSEWQGEGHNPLGALSVLGLLGVLTVLVSTGLFANDDIAFEGPLYSLVGKDLSDQLVSIHRLIEPVIILLVLAHIGAIIYYAYIKKENLVKPMIRGWKDSAQGKDARGGGIVALVVALIIAGGAVAAASGSLLPEPPPPPPPSAAPLF
jgi:cytochrome b